MFTLLPHLWVQGRLRGIKSAGGLAEDSALRQVGGMDGRAVLAPYPQLLTGRRDEESLQRTMCDDTPRRRV